MRRTIRCGVFPLAASGTAAPADAAHARTAHAGPFRVDVLRRHGKDWYRIPSRGGAKPRAARGKPHAADGSGERE